MLDIATRRRIDTARDILVGKVPDPKSQVEQITIALIYKFMDDMDAEAEELGGKRRFFADGFSKYGWAKLMHSGQGGNETLGLYTEAIRRMPQNPGIPLLFRDIFKNAFLPYDSPETLREFLKVIDEFQYDHSERLGDAFEYLLSVLGSQGKAGQFRTPRDIIDFIVAIVNPKKDETVLDPACGTAGFLISAYKHILRANIDDAGNAALTPDERAQLAENFRGYDIDPQMVKLSLANLYLHGFQAPNIDEYDTLTSQDNWNERADVILANPPFMSPKGGIRPHNRFSVQSKRSEVLFVDYMAEHLNPNGRAGIIVPEGIIFQSGTAYKQLRKMLVEEYLVGVISLPSGVFQPYSGVKTSILILDRVGARQHPNVMFSDVRHIGVSLGVARTKTEHNDLPEVIRDYVSYYSGTELSDKSWLVDRSEIVASELNLTGARYRSGGTAGGQRLVAIGDVCTITRGKFSSTKTPPGPYPLVLTAAEPKTASSIQFENDAVCVPLISSTGHGKATLHRIHFGRGPFALADLLVGLQPTVGEELDTKFLYYALDGKRADIALLMKGAANVSMKPEDLAQFQIPMPPLEVQREIVGEIEGYQRVIDGARAVVEGWRPRIAVDPEWPVVRLGDVCEVRSGGTPDRSNKVYWGGDIPWVTTTLVNFETIQRANESITGAGLSASSAWIVPEGTILMAMYGQGVTRGKVAVLGIDAAINQACAAFTINEPNLTAGYLFRILQSRYEDLRRISDARGGNQSNLSAQVLKDYTIPLPPLEMQDAIVAEIEQERTLVEANRELIRRMEAKVEGVMTRVWGKSTA